MTTVAPSPLALVAELTHRCPLHCVYCSNPLQLTVRDDELPTEVWARVFQEAAAAGVLQADLTGGEPLARSDIAGLVAAARSAGLYVSLITSGLPLSEETLAALVAAGLDHLQLSFQGATEQTAHPIAGTPSHRQKLAVLQWLKSYPIGVTLNFVIHRQNIQELELMLALVEEHQPNCAEFASVQYYGWALTNRQTLLPTRAQLDHCVATLQAAEDKLRGKTRLTFVVPDYYARFPKACVGGWGRKLVIIAPDGTVLPCHAASVIPGLCFDNVMDNSIREIWENSPTFRRFRGEDWMQEPCKSCERRLQDFGGCRCQAMLLAGDASSTDPVCSLSPKRKMVDFILGPVNMQTEGRSEARPNYLYRQNPSPLTQG